jgi:hypothetical protein
MAPEVVCQKKYGEELISGSQLFKSKLTLKKLSVECT